MPTSTVTTFTAVPIPGITASPSVFERLRRVVSHRPVSDEATGARSFHATSGTAASATPSPRTPPSCSISGPRPPEADGSSTRGPRRTPSRRWRASPPTPTSGFSSPSRRPHRRAMQLSRARSRPLVRSPAVHTSFLLVLPQYRRHGVGHALMEAAVAWAEEKDISADAPRSPTATRETNRFFARLGLATLANVRHSASTARCARSCPSSGRRVGGGRQPAPRRGARPAAVRAAGGRARLSSCRSRPARVGPRADAVGGSRGRLLSRHRPPAPRPGPSPAAAARRALAGLPRVLRAAGGELLDHHGAAHQRGLRLHLDADQRAARRAADPPRGRLRRVPRRPSAASSTPTTRPTAPSRPTSSTGRSR